MDSRAGVSSGLNERKRKNEKAEENSADKTLRTDEPGVISAVIDSPASPIRGNDEKFNLNSFFNDIIKLKPIDGSAVKIAFVLINHIVPTLPPFLSAVKKLGRIALIIPKASFRDIHVYDQLQSDSEFGKVLIDCFIDEYKDIVDQSGKPDYREIIRRYAANIIKKAVPVKSNERIVIIDIGGYFAPCLKMIHDDVGLRDRLIGIVEDTENGHQKYEEVVQDTRYPIVSVARSELKKTEDYNVGKSIVEAAGTIIRTDAHTMLERMPMVGVIGFGKIGRSIAEHLRQKNIREIVVYDLDVIRQMEASSIGFKVTSREGLLRQSDMIFCATGRKSLEGFDFYNLKDNVFIASCTSSDDELDLLLLKRKAKKAEIKKQTYISKYYLDEKRVNLIYDGNAVNFVHGAVNGPYIYSVQAGLILAAIALINGSIKPMAHNMIQEITRDDMSNIANVWLKNFENYSHESNFHIDNPRFLAELSFTADAFKAITYLCFASNLYKNNKDKQNIKPLVQFLYKFAVSFDGDELKPLKNRISHFYEDLKAVAANAAGMLITDYLSAINTALVLEFVHFSVYLYEEMLTRFINNSDTSVKSNIFNLGVKVYLQTGDALKVFEQYQRLIEIVNDVPEARTSVASLYPNELAEFEAKIRPPEGKIPEASLN